MDDLEWKARMINSIYSKRQIKITWVVDPTKSEDDRYVNVGVPVSITRRYAERKRTDLARPLWSSASSRMRREMSTKTGKPVTVYDQTTGTWGNAQEDADSNFTVWMGYNRYQLVLQGHIYVVWDEKESGYLKKWKPRPSNVSTSTKASEKSMFRRSTGP